MVESDFFILTSDARDEKGSCTLRYWGISSQGPVLVLIRAHRPLFFIPHNVSIPDTIDAERKALELHDFNGESVDALYFTTVGKYHDARRIVREAGIRSYESDVRVEDRYLMERYINSSALLEGAFYQSGNLRIFENPRISPSSYRPRLSTVSLDIETGRNGEVYGIALDYSGSKGRIQKAAVLDESASGAQNTGAVVSEPEVRFLPTERALVEFLLEFIAETDPDILIGWHVIGFDLRFLDGKSQALGIPLALGRGPTPLRLRERAGLVPIAELEGRLIIDGPPSLRGTFHRFSDWRLDTVAHELLGRGKDISEHGSEKVAEIERRFREDKNALARYNLEDAVLVTEIFQKTALIEQLLTRSLITGLPPDQVHRSVAAFDRFFLPRLHRKSYVAPNQADVSAGAPAAGGMVFTAGAGLFEDVAVLDFKSLYPTIIRTFHIDPYSLLQAQLSPMNTPVGITFSASEHILPEFLSRLMERRAEAKKDGDVLLAQAIKILMNSMYGVMGSPGCRFYRAELPGAITGIGRWILDTSAKRLKAWGYEVLYGDTDSLFVKLKTEEKQNADASGRRLAARVDEYFRDYFLKEYGVSSRLELEYEKRYVRLFLPVMRGSGEAAVKRYAGLLDDGTLEIKGMEFVRSDSTELAREFQHELFKRYFAGENPADWIRDTVVRLKAGEFDDKLVYRRRLHRRASEYKSPPPHVRAAMMLDPDGKQDIREVAYVITPEGPVPLQFKPKEIDYKHYIEKQIKPQADDVLSMNGESFDSVIGGKQLDLF